MKEVIAMHGWLGDSSSWQNWRSYFEIKGWRWQSGERGYGDITPIIPIWEQNTTPIEPERKAIIAHSLGPHLLNSEVFEKATDVVLLCSFAQFLPQNPPDRTLVMALKGMQKQLGSSKETEMLNSFLTKACLPYPKEILTAGPMSCGLSAQGRKKLKSDLELLRNTKGLPKGFSPKARVLIIEGSKDQIVASASRTALVKEIANFIESPPSHWELPDQGHLLIKPELIKEVYKWLEFTP